MTHLTLEERKQLESDLKAFLADRKLGLISMNPIHLSFGPTITDDFVLIFGPERKSDEDYERARRLYRTYF